MRIPDETELSSENWICEEMIGAGPNVIGLRTMYVAWLPLRLSSDLSYNNWIKVQ